MRILIVSQYFWPEGFRINDVVRSLVERGMDVDVLTGKPNYPEGKIFAGFTAWGCEQQQWNGANVFRMPLIPRGRQSALGLISNYLSFIISGLMLGYWLLRRRKYDVVFVYGISPILQAIPAIFLSWLKCCPLVVWVQDLWPESLEATGYIRKPWMLGCVTRIVRFIYRHTDLLLVQSQAFVSHVEALAPGKKVRYYPNAVEAIFCNPPDVTLPAVPELDEGFSVVFAGNVGTAQAVEVIVEAATLLRDHDEIRFVVFGQGSRWEWMSAEINARGLRNVFLPGRFPIETMPGLMAKASALLVSLADQPIFAATVPNKVQAYMAAGRPVLASLNGEGARLVKEAGAGLAIPAEDAKALAEAVLELYRMSPEDRNILGQNGRRYYQEHFDHDTLIDELIVQLGEVSPALGGVQ